eukprot:853319-Amphidinium_carterae.1
MMLAGLCDTVGRFHAGLPFFAKGLRGGVTMNGGPYNHPAHVGGGGGAVGVGAPDPAVAVANMLCYEVDSGELRPRRADALFSSADYLDMFQHLFGVNAAFVGLPVPADSQSRLQMEVVDWLGHGLVSVAHAECSTY